jgi:hypothetical protein
MLKTLALSSVEMPDNEGLCVTRAEDQLALTGLNYK